MLSLTVAAVVLAPWAPAHAATATCHGVKATIVGTARSEMIEGTPGRDVITGLGGSDVIHGGRGDDLICGGQGADHLFGGAGDDRLLGGPDLFRGPHDEDGSTRTGDTLAGGPGDDYLDAGADDRAFTEEYIPDTITWATSRHGLHLDLGQGTARGEGHDTFAPGAFISVGSSHADVVVGSSRRDLIQTGAGRDVVHGRGGADQVIADAVSNAAGADSDRVWGGTGDDEIVARHGHDLLVGGAGDDDISSFGTTGDVITTGPGDDVLYAEIGRSKGPQSWDGGAGSDRLRVAGDAINPDRLASTGTWDMVTGAMRVEVGQQELSLTAIGFEDSLLAGAHPATPDPTWTVTGTPGDDGVAADPNQSVPVHFDGLAGDDTFRGTDGDDLFDGGPGNDRSYGMFGGDDTCISVETLDLGDCEHLG